MENTGNNAPKSKGCQLIKGTGWAQIMLGLLVLFIGAGILLRRLDIGIPRYLLGWEMALILIGLFLFARNGLRDVSWIIPMAIGGIFLADQLMPGMSLKGFIWPALLMGFGLFTILKGLGAKFRNRKTDTSPTDYQKQHGIASDTLRDRSEMAEVQAPFGFSESLEVNAVFGGVKRNVVSKNFRGGEIVAVFGGAEIDLTHADIQGTVTLESVNVLGGCKLLVPPTWEVHSEEMTAVFGGVEDKRRIDPAQIDRSKRLVITGTCFLGGLEIKSY